MITTAFIDLAYAVLSGLISILPAGGVLPTAVHTATTTLGGYLGALDPILPISTLATTVGIAFAVELGIYGFRTLKWVLSHIPFIGGKG